MKYVVFSDLHGNANALKSMLDDLKRQSIKIEGFIFCGDVAGYYYQQNQIIYIFKQMRNLIAVKGNHDSMFEKILSNSSLKNDLARKYGNSYLKTSDLSKDYIEYLNRVPEMWQKKIEEKRVGIFHGMPNDKLNGRFYPDTVIDYRQFDKFDVVFLGHTHYQMRIETKNTIIINPGSLGQPRDGKGFSYCIFNFKTLTSEFRCVETNRAELMKEINSHETDEEHKMYLKEILFR